MKFDQSQLGASGGLTPVAPARTENAHLERLGLSQSPYRNCNSRIFEVRPAARVVELGKVQTDSSAFRVKYEPGHPSADINGNVKYSNVNPLIELTDMREVQLSYEANINVISATLRMIQRSIDILKD